MKFFFGDRDIVAVIGDSNTSAEVTKIAYLQFLQYFYRIRFPERKIRWLNCGIAGDTYATAADRLEWDVFPKHPNKAVIHLGTNDICYANYPRQGENSDLDYQNIGNVYQNCIDLIQKLQQQGIMPSLILPGGFYELEDHPRAETFCGANSALQELSSRIKDYAAAHEIVITDLFPFFEKIRSQMPACEITPDRIHFHTIIHLLIAAIFAENLESDPIVASVHLNHPKTALRAEVENVCISKCAASFIYKPRALPFYNAPVCQQLEHFFPFAEGMNQEILLIKDLEPGQYQLFLDGKPAGIYSAEDWEAGVNIACLKENPNQLRSAQLYQLLCTDWYSPMHDLRRLAYQIEHCMKLGINLNRISEYKPNNTLNVEPAFLKFCGNYYETILALFQQKEINERILDHLWLEAASITPCQYPIKVCRIPF